MMTEGFPDDANGRVLAGMRASGADMTARYDIDFEHVFPDLHAAEAFERTVAGRGRRLERSEYTGAGGHFWQVRVVVRMVPTHAGVTRMEREFGAAAESCGGRADGWGVLA
jgi:hypothetical protein